MKEILEIFVNDVKKICKRPIAVIIMIGLLIIPGIYAWLNIDSNWNPYDNTGNLPIAIVNKDEGITILDKYTNMGESMVESLKENNAMDWKFTDEETARENVDKSLYYGEIVIPEDFSSKLLTIFDGGNIEKPKFDFYINQKKNPIAPIIVNKAVTTIQTSLNQTFANTVFCKVMDTADEADILTIGAKTTDELIQKLNKSKENIGQLRTVLKTMALASDSTSKSLNAVRELMPTFSEIAGTSKQGVQDLQNAISSLDKTYDNMSSNTEKIMESVKSISQEINDIINSTDSSNLVENLDIISKKLDEIANKLKSLQDALNKVGTIIQIDKIDEMQQNIQKVLDDIEDLQNTIANVKETAENIDQIKEKINKLNEDISNMGKTYQDGIKDTLQNAYTNSSENVTSITELISKIDSSLGRTDSAMDSMISALNNTKELTDNIDIILSGLQSDIDEIIKNLDGTKQGEAYNKIVRLLQNSPNDIADFLSTLVETNEIDVYEIESYGSKMAPFYTVLACWVGCTLLVSILKTDLKKTEKTDEYKNYQKFLGRFMLFGTMAVLQGLIIGIGDIILQVQVLNKPLFLFTIVLSSFVFMLFIYSLTISFGKVGEAAAVVIMVLQVAGSGGTFPIELLPRLFQILQPFMPFYPAMNALRETIGGFYQNDYMWYILGLLCHTIIPLLLGLCFRKKIIHLKEKVDEELEKTDIIV